MQRFLRYIFASIAIVKDYFSIIGELRRHAPGEKGLHGVRSSAFLIHR